MDVKLDAYEGPLDLLLRLIEKNEIDIYDIPIAQLTDQYLEIINAFAPDMDGISEFLLMAATLLEIKSRMLLPKPPAEDEPADPREVLVRQLLEYKRCKTLADQLKSFPGPGTRLIRGGDPTLPERLAAYSPAQVMEDFPLEALWRVFADVVKRRELRIDRIRAPYGDMPRERFTVEEKITLIDRYLSVRGSFYLSDLFEACDSREEMLVTFLALLEMIRLGRLHVQQTRVFEDIEVTPCRAHA